MRILVAEDETIIRLDLVEMLARAGLEVCAEARDGEEAVTLAREHAPDLAIMDVKMPRLDGIEAARRILDERPIPIVMLTAYGQEELVNRAVEAGVFGYLVKPVRGQDLLPAVTTPRARPQEVQAAREGGEAPADAPAGRQGDGTADDEGGAHRGGCVRPAAAREPGFRTPAEGDRGGRDRYARPVMTQTLTPPRERSRRSTGSGTGDAWRVIVLNDNHNTFEG